MKTSPKRYAVIKAWQAKNRARYLSLQAQWRENRRKLIEDLKNSPCTDCGKSYPPYVMDFDHKDPSQKAFGPAEIYRNLEQVLAEIEKCELVCANCHRERTYGPNAKREGPHIKRSVDSYWNKSVELKKEA